MTRAWIGRDDRAIGVNTRQHHLANVVPLHRPARVSPNHPSMYDREDVDANAADQCVLLTKVEAAHIATLLNVARAHLPNPKAVDEAIDLLLGRRP